MFEKMFPKLNWPRIYGKIIAQESISEIKACNYKIIFDALSCNQKFNKTKRLCRLCNKRAESRDHLFLECEISQMMFQEVRCDISYKEI